MKRFCTLPLLLLVFTVVSAQSSLYQQYIERYRQMAVTQMERHGVPASITLAQGLLESGAGTSMLATKANNHFGIKTGGTWTGDYVVKSDDRPNERFRKYRSVEESFEDHSLFLKSRARYAPLFSLERTDYKGWARGLKAAGYATNPEYANKLISIIELYGLHQYDQSPQPAASGAARERHRHHAKQPASVEAKPAEQLRVGRCNDRYYVIAREGDDFRSIARQVKVREKKLRKYNEAGDFYRLRAGDIVYLEKKAARVAREVRGTWYTIGEGESLYSVAQKFGVQLRTLYRTNLLREDYVPRVGDRLWLR